MGTSRSAAELARKLNDAANGMRSATAEGVRQASLAGKEIMIEGAATSGVTPASRIPRWTNGTWSVNFKVAETARSITSYLKYRGALHWIEGGTLPHYSEREDSSVSHEQFVKFPDGSIRRGPIFIGGAKPKPFWDATKARLVDAVPKVMAAAHHRNLLEKFGP